MSKARPPAFCIRTGVLKGIAKMTDRISIDAAIAVFHLAAEIIPGSNYCNGEDNSNQSVNFQELTVALTEAFFRYQDRHKVMHLSFGPIH